MQKYNIKLFLMNLIDKIFTTSFLYKWAFILTLNYKIDFCEKILRTNKT